ncbi:12425_t:CDS:2 [Funneliformis caledonium]|uniref:12425_t:CDS:1 n=1 Tax=Funneliformis caledonium TaxID=1117310 RepID=A0A9N9A364_9GLOM|nr:12425_t:CDS:2 [Funneliformis caledonium]
MSTSTPVTPRVEDIEGYDTETLITYLQNQQNQRILNLREDHIDVLRENEVSGYDFLKLKKVDLERYGLKLGPAKIISKFVIKLNNQRLLNSEKYLSCIPPAIGYPQDASNSSYSTNTGGIWPSRIIRWNGFLEEVTRFSFNQTPKFERSQFVEGLRARVKNSVETAMDVNIFRILNQFLLPEFEFSKQNDSVFNNDNPKHWLRKTRFHLYEDNHFTGYASGDLINVISQLYNYMVTDELQYGILASYDHHFFFRRPIDNPSVLLISESLPFKSTNPPVLKTYAFLVHLANINPESPHPNLILGRTRQGSSNQNSGSNNQSFNDQSQSSGLGTNYRNQQDSRDQSSEANSQLSFRI